MNAYGKKRLNIVFQPVEGRALPMKTGELMRITQIGNGQCVDFNCFNLHDYKEHLSVGFTRMHSFRPRKGDFLWSNPPRNNPMMAIVEMLSLRWWSERSGSRSSVHALLRA